MIDLTHLLYRCAYHQAYCKNSKMCLSADSAKETAAETDADKARLDNSAGKMGLDIWLGLTVVLISLFY